MGKKKQFRAYLYTRSKDPSDKRDTKLRVRVVANGKSHFATFPLLVCGNFSKYFNSDGSFREGKGALSFYEKYEEKCIKAAYKSACNVAAYMLSIHEDYWRLAPNDFFADLVNSEYYYMVEGVKGSHVADRKKNDKERAKKNRVPFAVEELADWRYHAGEAIKPPTWLGSHMDYAAWRKHFEEGGHE